MTEKGYLVGFAKDVCTIFREGNLIGRARRERGLWVLDATTETHLRANVASLPYVASATLKTWHKRLGHAMTRSVKKIFGNKMVTGMDMIADQGDLREVEDDEHEHEHKGKCIPCLQAKTTRAPIPKTTTTENP